MRLSDIPDWPIAIDLRIGLPEASRLRAKWHPEYSLWPDDPFGASADNHVWPSAFVQPAEAAPDRITLIPGKAPYWDCFYQWSDVREMTNHIRPLPIVTNVVALGFHNDPSIPLRHDYALAGLVKTGVTPDTLEMEAAFMGYDITDDVLESAVFANDGEGLDASDVPRSAYGLIATLDAARDLRPRLELCGPPHAPLYCISVWSLGERPATPSA